MKTTSHKRCLKLSETGEAYWKNLPLLSFWVFASPMRWPHAVSTISKVRTLLRLFLTFAYPSFRFTTSWSCSVQFEISGALCCALIALSSASCQTQLSSCKSHNSLSRLTHWTSGAGTPLLLGQTLSFLIHLSCFYCFRQPNQEWLIFSIPPLIYHSEWSQIASYPSRQFLTFKFKFYSLGLPLKSFVGQS